MKNMAKRFWTSEHNTDVIAENLIPKPTCGANSQIFKSGCRDWLQFNHRSISEVQHGCWAMP